MGGRGGGGEGEGDERRGRRRAKGWATGDGRLTKGWATDDLRRGEESKKNTTFLKKEKIYMI